LVRASVPSFLRGALRSIVPRFVFVDLPVVTFGVRSRALLPVLVTVLSRVETGFLVEIVFRVRSTAVLSLV
jgi:hypothetical protein